MPARNGLKFGINSPKLIWVSHSEFLVTGWAVSRGSADRLQIVASLGDIEVQGEYGLPRPDVAEHFDDRTLGHCGFVVRINARQDGDPIRLFARQGERETPLVDIDPMACEAAETPFEYRAYQEWIRWTEPGLFIDQRNVPAFLAAIEYRPLISIILPTYNTPSYFLRRCLDSVIKQQYWNWELCIADDNSSDEQTASILETY